MTIAPLEFEVKLSNCYKIEATKLTVVTEIDEPTCSCIGEWNPSNLGVVRPINDIIQTDQDVTVIVDWQVSGSLAGIICGEYVTTVYCERMGKGEVTNDDCFAVVPHVSTSKTQPYEAIVTIPKNTLDAGVYRLVVAINFRTTPAAKGMNSMPIPVAGFCDLGLIQVYQGE